MNSTPFSKKKRYPKSIVVALGVFFLSLLVVGILSYYAHHYTKSADTIRVAAYRLTNAYKQSYGMDQVTCETTNLKKMGGFYTWPFYHYTIKVSNQYDAAKITDPLHGVCEKTLFSFSESPQKSNEHFFSLFFDDIPWGNIHLILLPGKETATAPVSQQPKTKLTAEPQECADMVEKVLRPLLASSDYIARESASEQLEDTTAVWTPINLHIQLPSNAQALDLFASLESALNTQSHYEITHALGTKYGAGFNSLATQTGSYLNIGDKGREFVRVFCSCPLPFPVLSNLLPNKESETLLKILDPFQLPAPPETPWFFSDKKKTMLTESPVAPLEETGAMSHDTASSPEKTVAPPAMKEATSQSPEKTGIEPVHPFDHPRIAIILDDGGYGKVPTEIILQLDNHLTLSIMPHSPIGTSTAKRAHELGFEVMLHMPMDFEAKHKPEKDELNTRMPENTIRRITEEAFDSVPFAVGTNNHTGSVFTCYKEPMQAFLTVVKEKNMFFVDSLTTPKSVAYKTAKEMGLRAAKRNVFLDLDKDKSLMEKRFDQLVKHAQKTGIAIAIGHFHKDTAIALQTKLPWIKSQGIELVHASELVE